MEDLEARVRTLETELGVLKDRAAIQDLRFRYHVAVNEKELESIPRLFTEEAEVEFEGIGAAHGRIEIDALYREVVGTSPFIKQFIHNHVINLEGDSGTGLSYLDARTVANGKSMLVAARFDDEYSREAGGWMFRSLRLKLFFAVPLEDGWAGKDRIQLG